MTLDTRARQAAQGIHQAVEFMEKSRSTTIPRMVERFDRFRDRKQRNRRVGAVLVAALVAIVTIVVVTNAFERRDTTIPVTPSSLSGRIVFGQEINEHGYVTNHVFTMNPDGTDVRDLSARGSCMSWASDGGKILLGGTIGANGETSPLATLNPDGTGYTALHINPTPYMSPGCGAYSPDGTRIVLPGLTSLVTAAYHPEVDGIYTVRASDGGDLVRLTHRSGAYPSYSPDGSQIVFEGVRGPRGACAPPFPCPDRRREGHLDGSLLVMNADGSGLHPIASPKAGLLHAAPSWSPDGRWILFSDGTTLYVVHPDGTRLRRITLETVPRLRYAIYPSWSPDGTRFVFVGGGSPWFNLFTARTDGTDVEQITHTRDIYYSAPDWGPTQG